MFLWKFVRHDIMETVIMPVVNNWLRKQCVLGTLTAICCLSLLCRSMVNNIWAKIWVQCKSEQYSAPYLDENWVFFCTFLAFSQVDLFSVFTHCLYIISLYRITQGNAKTTSHWKHMTCSGSYV